MQEYVDAWDHLYEFSRYLARAYRYYLAIRPARRPSATPAEGLAPKDRVFDKGMTWRRKFIELKAFVKIIWWQGVRTPYRRQFWTQLIGMWRHNPTRFVEYILTCAMGEDLFNMRRIVREKAMAIMKERQIEVSAVPCPGGATLQGGSWEAHLDPSSSGAIQD